jgi:alpha-1,2-mannosyltransferase
MRSKLWKGLSLVALFIATLLISSFMMPSRRAGGGSGFGMDYIAFYRAGTLVHTGHADRLYDLQNTIDFDRDIARRLDLPAADVFGPFLNPPFFAWIFSPLSTLNYGQSLFAWMALNICCFVGAAALLCRIIPKEYDLDPNQDPIRDWQNVALVPALMVVSLPFIQTIGHAQDTFISLLLMSWAVVCWRERRAVSAGIAAGLLFYKPQLAAVVVLPMVFTLGWHALAGACISIESLILLNTSTLPGTLTKYRLALAPNVQYTLAVHPYLWQRHATFNGFWHGVLSQISPAAASSFASYIAIACSIPIVIGLIICVWRNHKNGSRDRLIAAVIAAAPLIMPYYLDYDLLLLSIPAVLLAAEMIDRGPAQTMPRKEAWLIRLWVGLFLLLLINPGLTSVLHMNLSVPLLAGIAGLSIARAAQTDESRISDINSFNSQSAQLWQSAA